jgi:hypothetical protein
MHTGINYYYFNDAINTLAANGFLRGSSSAFKSNTMAGAINRVAIKNFTSAYMGTVVGASGIYGVIVAFFMFPNAELALMFIPVPIKAKYLYPV